MMTGQTPIAAVHVSVATTNDTFDSGELTVEIIAQVSGLADGSTLDADDFGFI